MATHIATFFEHVAQCANDAHHHYPAVLLYLPMENALPPEAAKPDMKGLH
jgi:hypothetical protein